MNEKALDQKFYKEDISFDYEKEDKRIKYKEKKYCNTKTLIGIAICIFIGFALVLVFYFKDKSIVQMDSSEQVVQNDHLLLVKILNYKTVRGDQSEYELINFDPLISISSSLSDFIHLQFKDYKKPISGFNPKTSLDGKVISLLQYKILYVGTLISPQMKPKFRRYNVEFDIYTYCLTPDNNGIIYTTSENSEIYRRDFKTFNESSETIFSEKGHYLNLSMTEDNTLLFSKAYFSEQKYCILIYKKAPEKEADFISYFFGQNCYPIVNYAQNMIFVTACEEWIMVKKLNEPESEFKRLYNCKWHKMMNLALSKDGKHLYVLSQLVSSLITKLHEVEFDYDSLSDGKEIDGKVLSKDTYGYQISVF